MKEELLSRIAGKQIVVGVVGLGYVGLPLAVEKAKAGFKTIGFDVQADKVKMPYQCCCAERSKRYYQRGTQLHWRCGGCRTDTIGCRWHALRHY